MNAKENVDELSKDNVNSGNGDIPQLLIVLPAFLEEANIRACLTGVLAVFEEESISFRIRVVVDGPGDGTATQARMVRDDRVEVIELDKNYGKGRAIREGMSGCTTEFVGFLDADLDLNPKSLGNAVQILQQSTYPVVGVLGSKLHPQSIVDYPITRRLISRCYKIVVRLLFDLNIEDTQTGLKVFRTESVMNLINELSVDGFAFDLELLTNLSKQGGTFLTSPIILNYKFDSSIRIRTVFQMLKATSELFWKLKK
jgi:glycosyltransferase involved in cell wall biosynthesis